MFKNLYGGSGIRTHDLHLAKVPLYQLSYTPFKFSKAKSYYNKNVGRWTFIIALAPEGIPFFI